MSKVQFTRHVWEEVDRHQEEELKLAICGVSAEYEFAEFIAPLEVPVDEWFDMNEDERKACVHEFNKMTVEAAVDGKTITASHLPTVQASEFCSLLQTGRTVLLPLLSRKHYLTSKMQFRECHQSQQMNKGNIWLLQRTARKAYTNVQSTGIMQIVSVHASNLNNLRKHSTCVAEIAVILR